MAGRRGQDVHLYAMKLWYQRVTATFKRKFLIAQAPYSSYEKRFFRGDLLSPNQTLFRLRKATQEAKLMHQLNILILNLDSIGYLAAMLGLLQQESQQVVVSCVITSGYQSTDVQTNTSGSDVGISFVLPQAAVQRPLVHDWEEEDLAVTGLVPSQKAFEQLFISRVFLGN